MQSLKHAITHPTPTKTHKHVSMSWGERGSPLPPPTTEEEEMETLFLREEETLAAELRATPRPLTQKELTRALVRYWCLTRAITEEETPVLSDVYSHTLGRALEWTGGDTPVPSGQLDATVDGLWEEWEDGSEDGSEMSEDEMSERSDELVIEAVFTLTERGLEVREFLPAPPAPLPASVSCPFCRTTTELSLIVNPDLEDCLLCSAPTPDSSGCCGKAWCQTCFEEWRSRAPRARQ